MTTPYSRLRFILVYVTGYLVVTAILVIHLFSMSTHGIRLLTIGLVLIFGGLMIIPKIYSLDQYHLSQTPEWPVHLYLAAQTVIIILLLVARDETFSDAPQRDAMLYPLLVVPLCLQVVFMLPLRGSVSWIAAFLIIFNGILAGNSGEGEAFFRQLPYTIVLIFAGIFAFSLSRGEIAQRKSLALLQKLRAAHSQLQEHTLQAKELATSEERNRLARELHDVLGHRLTVAAVQLEGAQRLIPTQPERAAAMVGTVHEQTLEALNDLRKTVSTLRAPLPTNLSLPATLARLIDNFQEATGIVVHQSLPDDMPALPDTYWLGLYRAAQESLTNIQRHAQAKEAWLTLSFDNNAAALLVQDDGIGFPPQKIQVGFGLRGLRERAVQLGGSLTLGAGPAGGAQLLFNLPLPTHEDFDNDPDYAT